MPSRRAAPLVDLHAHTTASDGSDHPRALVAAAAAAGVGVLAVTDHDTVTAVPEAQAAGQDLGVQVLAGCELTTLVGDRVVHVLLYGQGLLEPGLAQAVEVARRGRYERNLAIGQRLQQLTGVGYQQAAALAGGSALSRAHFAQALLAAGVVTDTAEAFDRYLSAGRPAYVPAPSVPLADAVALAAKAAGLPAMASSPPPTACSASPMTPTYNGRTGPSAAASTTRCWTPSWGAC